MWKVAITKTDRKEQSELQRMRGRQKALKDVRCG